MPAKSTSQQHLMGMVHAYKEGKLDTKNVPASLLSKIKKIAKGISDEDAKHFAETKHKGLPKRVKEGKTPIKKEHQEKYKTISPERQLKYLMDLGYSKGEIEDWTGKRSTRSPGWEKPTDRKPKKAKKESYQPTFKQYLIEITQKERQMLVPPPAVQKIYNQIKQKYGFVKRDVFFNKLADRLNLSVAGLQRLQQLPALRALPFADEEDKLVRIGGPQVPVPGET